MLHKIIALGLLLLLPVTAHSDEIVINAVGDIMLAGSATATLNRLGYQYPFEATVAELKKGDITVGNLEAPLARGGGKSSPTSDSVSGPPPRRRRHCAAPGSPCSPWQTIT